MCFIWSSSILIKNSNKLIQISWFKWVDSNGSTQISWFTWVYWSKWTDQSEWNDSITCHYTLVILLYILSSFVLKTISYSQYFLVWKYFVSEFWIEYTGHAQAMACRLGLLQKQTILLCKRMQVVHIIGPEKGNFGAFFVVPGGFAKTFVFDRKLPTIYYSLFYSA